MPIAKKKNEDFFKKWSHEMAYVLGFFAADGCMIENKRGAHFIEFHITDKDILEKIREVLGSNHAISARNINDVWKTEYKLQIGSKVMFQDLLLRGMMPRKSNTLKFPDVPKKYLSDFIRGYFDGDGNVYIHKFERANRNNKVNINLSSGFTSGSEEFLRMLQKRLKEIGSLKGGSLHFRSGAYRLYYSTKDSKRLYTLMYGTKKELLCLQRKRVIFETCFEMKKPRKE